MTPLLEADKLLHKIADAKQLAEGLARVQPNQAPWSTLFTLLEAYEGKVRDHWPLTPEQKEAFGLGWFSIKNIEEVFPQLHSALSEVAYTLRHGGESRP